MPATDHVIVPAPASKSISHRAVMAAALSVGESRLSNVLESEDLHRTIDCLRLSGAGIEKHAPGEYSILGFTGVAAGGGTEPLVLDVGESGTTCRLLAAILAAGNGVFEIRGCGRMHDRPIGELTDALSSVGAYVEFIEKPGYPPFRLTASGISGGTVPIGLDESSQYLSGLVLAAPVSRKPLTVETHGQKAVSWPYVGLTLQVMEDFGARVRVERLAGGRWEPADWRSLTEVRPGEVRFPIPLGMYLARQMRVEGDYSNAANFLAAGAVGPGPVSVDGLRPDSFQGDRAILDILSRMGARVEWDGDRVTVSPARLRGLELDMGRCPDLVPPVAMVAALASGETVIRNVAHLRLKESDRLAAVAGQLSSLGAGVETFDDGLRILPRELPRGPVELRTHQDHRLAMSPAILQRRGVDIRLDDPSVVAKSFPDFWERWEAVL